MPTQNEIRQSITNRIIEALQSGDTLPWRKPWCNDLNAGFPANLISKRNYRGINPLLLEIASMRHNFKSRWWATWNQWQDLGGRVVKRPDDVPPGSWGTTIVFCKPVVKTVTDDNGEEDEEKFFILRTYSVFNLDQVQGEHLDHLRVGYTTMSPVELDRRYERADTAIVATGATIEYGGNQAFYNRKSDYIQLPYRHQFPGLTEFYETAFHELVHWTEHPSRLDWDRTNEGYAMGELIAEIGGCYTAAALGLGTADRLSNHASYLSNWLEAMQNDSRFIFKASTQASRAADYLLSFSQQEAEKPEEALVE